MLPFEIGLLMGGLGGFGWGLTWFSGKDLRSDWSWLVVIATGVMSLMIGGGCGIVIQVILSAAGITEPVVYR